MNFSLVLQPKQSEVWDNVENGTATWIGLGGGRGGSKSYALQRIMLVRRLQRKGTVGCILMRNSDQVRRYHEDIMLRAWPQLESCYAKTERKIVIPCKDGAASEIQFSYAEALPDVIRRFRSANYFDIFIDQAEQFSEAELREIKQAVRWPNVPLGTCKLLLSFNMGGIGIGFLRQKFHLMEYNERENPADYRFTHVRPFDNAMWCLPALERDGLTQEEYYSWSDDERKQYCATQSDYGKALVGQDDALVKRDFEGSWESLEGSFFGRSFDRDTTVLTPEQAHDLIKPWWERWLCLDWGRGHYTVTYWMASGEIGPMDAKRILGWDIHLSIKIVVIYREYIAGGEAMPDGGGRRELSERDIARKIVSLTPQSERDELRDFVISPDAGQKRREGNTITEEIGNVMSEHHFPYPRPADDNRVSGWALMSNLLLSSKRQGQLGDQALLISANCANLISSIPLAMRNTQTGGSLDDILKTDKGAAKMEMDCLDACRYGLQSKLSAGKMPAKIAAEQRLQEMKEAGMDEHSFTIYTLQAQQEVRNSGRPVTMGRRRGPIVRR